MAVFKKHFLLTVGLISFVGIFIASAGLVLAAPWTAPQAAPPEGNPEPPLDVSDQEQTKAGNLNVSSVFSAGRILSGADNTKLIRVSGSDAGVQFLLGNIANGRIYLSDANNLVVNVGEDIALQARFRFTLETNNGGREFPDSVLLFGYRDTDGGLKYDRSDGKLKFKNGNGEWTEIGAGQGGGESLWQAVEGGNDIQYSQGNVGIGTNAPASKLHVVSDANSPLKIDTSAGTNYIRLGGGAENLGLQFTENASTSFFTWIGSLDQFRFYTGGGDGPNIKMVIGSNGNVAIGNVGHISNDDLNERLIIKGDAIGNAVGRSVVSLIGNPQNNWVGMKIADTNNAEKWFVGGNGGKLVIRSTEGNAAVNDIVVAGNGNVGIGTDNPEHKFTVFGGNAQIQNGNLYFTSDYADRPNAISSIEPIDIGGLPRGRHYYAASYVSVYGGETSASIPPNVGCELTSGRGGYCNLRITLGNNPDLISGIKIYRGFRAIEEGGVPSNRGDYTFTKQLSKNEILALNTVRVGDVSYYVYRDNGDRQQAGNPPEFDTTTSGIYVNNNPVVRFHRAGGVDTIRVGIGTDAPRYTFDVNGIAHIGASVNNPLKIDTSAGTNYIQLGGGAENLGMQFTENDTPSFFTWIGSLDQFRFYAGGGGGENIRMVVGANGNVAIGNVGQINNDQLNEKLVIKGDNAGRSIVSLLGNPTNANGWVGMKISEANDTEKWFVGGNSSNLVFRRDESFNDLFIDNSGITHIRDLAYYRDLEETGTACIDGYGAIRYNKDNNNKAWVEIGGVRDNGHFGWNCGLNNNENALYPGLKTPKWDWDDGPYAMEICVWYDTDRDNANRTLDYVKLGDRCHVYDRNTADLNEFGDNRIVDGGGGSGSYAVKYTLKSLLSSDRYENW